MVNEIFYEALGKLLDVVERLRAMMEAAGVSYRVVGGMAVYLHVEGVSENDARLTRDVDVLIRRCDLERVLEFAARYGVTIGEDVPGKRAVHLLFAGEKVRPDYLEAAPEIGVPVMLRGVPVAPIADLLVMKLTSYRLKDMMHVKDMQNAGIVTEEMEAGIPETLRERYAVIKAHE